MSIMQDEKGKGLENLKRVTIMLDHKIYVEQ